MKAIRESAQALLWQNTLQLFFEAHYL